MSTSRGLEGLVSGQGSTALSGADIVCLQGLLVRERSACLPPELLLELHEADRRLQELNAFEEVEDEEEDEEEDEDEEDGGSTDC